MRQSERAANGVEMKTAEELLLRTPWFQPLTPSLQESLLNGASLRAVEPDEYVCRRGVAADRKLTQVLHFVCSLFEQ